MNFYSFKWLLTFLLIGNLSLAVADDANVEQKADTTKAAKCGDLLPNGTKLACLEELIAKQRDEYYAAHKPRFINARNPNISLNSYVNSCIEKIEKTGNLNYPNEAIVNKLYGQLRITFTIKSDGNIENIKLIQSSGSVVLDDSAISFVKRSVPFSAFTDEVLKATKLLTISSVLTFTHEDMFVIQHQQ